MREFEPLSSRKRRPCRDPKAEVGLTIDQQAVAQKAHHLIHHAVGAVDQLVIAVEKPVLYHQRDAVLAGG